MWDLPRPGLKPVSPALAGRFSTTVPPGKPWREIFWDTINLLLLIKLSPTIFSIHWWFLSGSISVIMIAKWKVGSQFYVALDILFTEVRLFQKAKKQTSYFLRVTTKVTGFALDFIPTEPVWMESGEKKDSSFSNYDLWSPTLSVYEPYSYLTWNNNSAYSIHSWGKWDNANKQ